MKIAICDDIVEYRMTIKAFVNEYIKIHHIDCGIYEFENGEQLINADENFDVLFLDIELGDLNGLEVAKLIQSKNRKTNIIVVTSYNQYLDDAFDLNVIRFIGKPISQQRVFSALNKAFSNMIENTVALHIKNNQLIRLKISEIVFVEAKFKKVVIYTKSRDSYAVKETLKELKSVFPPLYFSVPHNSYIVNLQYVKEFKRDQITLTYPYLNHKIAVASRKQPIFRKKFFDFLGEDINFD